MKNFESIIDETYEFFDELLGSIIPGIYFCSYFVFCTFAVFFSFGGSYEFLKDHKYFALSLFIISYIIGTMCRRSNSREPDNISARHVYFNSIPRDDNDFAFCSLVTNKQLKQLIKNIKSEIKSGNINIDLDNDILERKRKYSRTEKIKANFKKTILFSQNNGKKYEETILSKPYVQRYIYQKLLDRIKELNKTKGSSKTEIKNIEAFIRKNHLENSCEIYVDYPYSNLKKYLEDRNLNDLAQLVTWKPYDNKKTNRSKSVICNMKLYIKHHSPKDYSTLLKSEAHIRFMNSIWYANKIISTFSFFVLIASSFLFVISSLIYHFKFLRAIREKMNSTTIELYESLKDSIKNLFSSSLHVKFEWDKLIGALLFIMIISLCYMLLSRLIIKTIKNNFHYQRVREVVSVLYIYKMLTDEEQTKKFDKEKRVKILLDSKQPPD